MSTKKKSSKMDKKEVAEKQKHEIKYISKRFKIKQAVVRLACKETGRSRVKVYQWLRNAGYTIKTRKYC